MILLFVFLTSATHILTVQKTTRMQCKWTLVRRDGDVSYHKFLPERPSLTFRSAAFFFLIASGIFVRFGVFVLDNRTTVEDLQRIHQRHCFAVRIDESELPRRTQTVGPDRPPPFYFIRYPFPNIYGQHRPSNATSNGTSTGSAQQPTGHYYAILMPKEGKNPWNLGNRRNLKAIMGNSVWDWFIPLQYSPCVNHDNGFCDFELGPDFYEMERQFLPHRYNSQGRRRTGSKPSRRRSRSRSRRREK
jgi:hypothetical protein